MFHLISKSKQWCISWGVNIYNHSPCIKQKLPRSYVQCMCVCRCVLRYISNPTLGEAGLVDTQTSHRITPCSGYWNQSWSIEDVKLWYSYRPQCVHACTPPRGQKAVSTEHATLIWAAVNPGSTLNSYIVLAQQVKWPLAQKLNLPSASPTPFIIPALTFLYTCISTVLFLLLSSFHEWVHYFMVFSFFLFLLILT